MPSSLEFFEYADRQGERLMGSPEMPRPPITVGNAARRSQALGSVSTVALSS